MHKKSEQGVSRSPIQPPTNYAVANEDLPVHVDSEQARLANPEVCALLGTTRLVRVRARQFLGRFPVVLLNYQQQQNVDDLSDVTLSF
jgi:hypothetical protein